MRVPLKLRLAPDGLGALEVNGKELPGARAVQLSVEAGSRPHVTVELAVSTLEVKGDDVEVFLPEATVESLIALGWTPPPAS